MDNLENLTPEQKEEFAKEKERKSRNRIFGLLIFVCILLLAALVYEIVLITKPVDATSSSSTTSTVSELATIINLLK